MAGHFFRYGITYKLKLNVTETPSCIGGAENKQRNLKTDNKKHKKYSK